MDKILQSGYKATRTLHNVSPVFYAHPQSKYYNAHQVEPVMGQQYTADTLAL